MSLGTKIAIVAGVLIFIAFIIYMMQLWKYEKKIHKKVIWFNGKASFHFV
jgi:hypothetical protein